MGLGAQVVTTQSAGMDRERAAHRPNRTAQAQ
jgi:hypothetical protein